MQSEHDTIPMSADPTPDWKNRFPGAVTFVETFDTDDNASEPADILSFESLREAFATLQSTEAELALSIPQIESSANQKPNAPEQPEYEIDDTDVLESEGDLSSPDTEYSIPLGIRLETVIEAMLFVGNRENRPLAADQIAEKMRNVSSSEVDQAVVLLNEQYQGRNSPYAIISESGGYRMVLRPEFEPVRTNFYGKIRESRLSQQAIDTLAVIAYRQPITAEEIQQIRRQSCSAVLQQLVRRNLLRVSRETQDNKSIVRYHTTPRFLELVHLQSLEDIPKVGEWD